VSRLLDTCSRGESRASARMRRGTHECVRHVAKEPRIADAILVKLMRGLHCTIGISTPPPEQERFYVFVWLAIGVLMVLFFLVMLWVMQ